MKKYTKTDLEKRNQDRIHTLREKGIVDVNRAADIHPLVPGGVNQVLDHIEKNKSAIKDQLQRQRKS